MRNRGPSETTRFPRRWAARFFMAATALSPTRNPFARAVPSAEPRAIDAYTQIIPKDAEYIHAGVGA